MQCIDLHVIKGILLARMRLGEPETWQRKSRFPCHLWTVKEPGTERGERERGRERERERERERKSNCIRIARKREKGRERGRGREKEYDYTRPAIRMHVGVIR